MNRISILLLSLALVLAVAARPPAAAGPIVVNGGPTPDPTVTAGCGGETSGVMFVNGGGLPRTAVDVTAGAPREPVLPIMLNGGPTPRPASTAARADRAWCAGAYRPDSGTNFAGSR